MRNEKPSDRLTAFEALKELSCRQVADYVGVTRTATVWKYVKEGKLPQPRYLAPYRPIWRFGEVIDHTHALMQKPSDSVQGFKGEALARDVHEKSSKLSKLKKRLGLS